MDDKQKILEELLKQAKEKLETEMEKHVRGENFNVFTILNIQHKELIHSRFIAELLNPNGSHGHGSKFLEGFLELIGLTNPYNELEKTKIQTEEVTPYGNLDISIKHKDFYVVIENKIWAGDQEGQLCRYAQTIYLEHEPKLVYLTLTGCKPSDYSLTWEEKKLDINNVVLLKYDQLIEKTPNVSHVNNCVLEQYKNCIETLKGTTQMLKIDDIKKDNIDAYLEIQKSLNSMLDQKKVEIMNNLITKLSVQLKTELSEELQIVERATNDVRKDARLLYFNKDATSYGIGIDSAGIYLGYYKYGSDYSNDEIQKLIQNKLFDKSRYIYLDSKTNLGHSSNTIFELLDDYKMQESVDSLFKDILKKIGMPKKD